jgi:hypothetical protein
MEQKTKINIEKLVSLCKQSIRTNDERDYCWILPTDEGMPSCEYHKQTKDGLQYHCKKYYVGK